MSRIGSLAVRLVVVFGLVSLIVLTTGGVILSHAPAYRFAIGVCAGAVAGIVSVAFWTAMRDIDGR